MNDWAGPAAEDTGIESGWFRLRRTIEFASGHFWLGVIAAQHTLWAIEMEQRTARLAANEGGRTERLAARSPDELAGFATTVGVDPTDTLVWVCVEQGALGTTDEWATAWRGLLAGLNRRREEIGRNLHDGLVIAGPAESPRWWREVAADLWSKRAVFIELAAQAPDDASSGRAGGEPDTETDAQADTEPDWRAWLAASENAAGDPTNPASPVFDEGFATSVRDLEQAIRQGDDRLVWAHDTANTLYEQRQALEAQPAQSAIAAFVAAMAADARSDPAAPTLLTDALSAGLAPRRRLIDACRLAATLGRRHPDQQGTAIAGARLLVEISEIGPGASTEAQLAARRYELIELADLLRGAGRLDEAAPLAAEALALDRDRVTRYGKTPDTLQALSISLERVGDLARKTGDLTTATTHHNERLALDRDRITRYGKTPDTLKALSISLTRVGDLAQQTGDLTTATTHHNEALALTRDRITRYGKTPDTLQDLSASLTRIALLATAQQLDDEAADAWWQATRIARDAFQLTGFGDAFGVKLLNWCLDEWAAAEERAGDAESAGEIRTERRVLEADYDRWLRDKAIR